QLPRRARWCRVRGAFWLGDGAGGAWFNDFGRRPGQLSARSIEHGEDAGYRRSDSCCPAGHGERGVVRARLSLPSLTCPGRIVRVTELPTASTHLLSIADVVDIGPRMRRITVAGEALANFT